MFSLFSSLSKWDWTDIAGVALVFIGVAGGYIAGCQKALPEPTSEDLEPVRLAKSRTIRRRKLWEHAWEGLLIIGLGLEIIALGHHIKESAQLNAEVEELRKENSAFAIAQAPRVIDSAGLANSLTKIRGIHFVLVNIPDWEASRLASQLEWSFEDEHRMYGKYLNWTFSRIVTVLDIPDGVHIGILGPPDPFDALPIIPTEAERLKVDKNAVSAYMNFEPSNASVVAAENVEKAFRSSGIEVGNWGKWLGSQFRILSRLGLPAQTNTVVILIGRKPNPEEVLLASLRGRASDLQHDTNSSPGKISNAWYAVFDLEEKYRARQIRLGLFSTNAPHSTFSPTGWNGDGSPRKP